MRVWVARAQPGATATAARLADLGHQALVAPLLEVRVIDTATLDLDGIGALAFTSANGVAAFAARSPLRALPVFAVGEATANAARAVGFATVRSAGGDVAALARLVIEAAPSGTVLHIAPWEPAGDLAGALNRAGVAARSVALYETVAVEALPPEAAEALRAGELEAVLIHSPKAARTLARLVGDAPGLSVFALSNACAASLQGGGFRTLKVAVAPDEAALLDLLGRG